MTHSTQRPALHGQEVGVQVTRPRPSYPREPAGPRGFRAPEPATVHQTLPRNRRCTSTAFQRTHTGSQELMTPRNQKPP